MRIGVGAIAAVSYDADQNGRVRTRNLMVVLLGFSVVGVFDYAQLWGGLFIGI